LCIAELLSLTPLLLHLPPLLVDLPPLFLPLTARMTRFPNTPLDCFLE
jgi:hypothetical protein